MGKRIQRKRTKGWKMPPNTVYVGRPTKWGNPFRVRGKCFIPAIQQTAAQAVKRFRESIHPVPLQLGFAQGDISELRGKDLACWCPLDQPCHADVLLEIANQGG